MSTTDRFIRGNAISKAWFYAAPVFLFALLVGIGLTLGPRNHDLATAPKQDRLVAITPDSPPANKSFPVQPESVTPRHPSSKLGKSW